MRLSVTTPRGALVDTDVEEVTAPGELGEFGVLPGHVPLMSALKPGVPVNVSATWNGCDRKRWILRARATRALSSSESSSMPRMAMMSWRSA